ncbi:hypothetical protein CLIB1423_01S08504 [[Candida] railenensis]|uniref:54S ribosomal protein L40, mitochondrial n=1 Tax=[Candida] railenensis TaxID=45579 RepID=A0A9P0VWE0_9ASCO|nr:hypothetical protein CLIB1423_01S08504 [[Candida] railenensis]
MSVWGAYTKRFQRNMDKVVPRAIGKARLKDQNMYALPTLEQTHPTVPKSEQKTKPEQIGILAGDLAYISEGPQKGTISRILRYMPEYDGVLLMDVTSKKLLPKYSWMENQTTHVFDYPEITPLSQIKLAAKEKHEETGEITYVVADELEMKGRYFDARHKKWLPRRFVKNHDRVEIPWPAPEDPVGDADSEQTKLIATDSETALETTYELQTLAKPSIPVDVVNELRNPHSKYKKRYLSEYQARVMKAPDMPLSNAQKAYLAKKAEQEAKQQALHRGRPITNLSEEIQSFIGEKMASHINKIDNPHLLEHLEGLSAIEIPDFAATQQKIRDAESAEQKPEQK